MAFFEDACRIRKDYPSGSLAVMRHFAFNVLPQETRLKVGIENKRLNADWDTDYLLKSLVG